MAYEYPSPPPHGEPITHADGRWQVPDRPILPFIEGDGSGPEIWRATRTVLDAAVEAAYGGRRQIQWYEVFAGQKAFRRFGVWLPEETLRAFETYKVGIKGPLATPIGEGVRSVTVALRRTLDLYVCQRPVRWLPGVPSPVRHPEKVNMVVFRENTEDLYAEIEFPAESEINQAFQAWLQAHYPEAYARLRFPASTAFSLKPISRHATERLVRAAIRWALANRRRSVTLVHKGNIMKMTEGAFRNWGYDLAEREFGDRVYTQRQWERTRLAYDEATANQERQAALEAGKLWVKEVITDAAFEIAITRPHEFDVLATPNLSGDYLSDALAALVGGLGIAPGANFNEETGVAIFEATHGTAPTLAGKDVVNPTSLILSGEMLLRYIGWHEAADRVIGALEKVIAARQLTQDLYHLTEGATLLKTLEFTRALVTAIYENFSADERSGLEEVDG